VISKDHNVLQSTLKESNVESWWAGGVCGKDTCFFWSSLCRLVQEIRWGRQCGEKMELRNLYKAKCMELSD
jgi:hypothetical protein